MKQISTIKYKKIWHENNYPIEQHIQNRKWMNKNKWGGKCILYDAAIHK